MPPAVLSCDALRCTAHADAPGSRSCMRRPSMAATQLRAVTRRRISAARISACNAAHARQLCFATPCVGRRRVAQRADLQVRRRRRPRHLLGRRAGCKGATQARRAAIARCRAAGAAAGARRQRRPPGATAAGRRRVSRASSRRRSASATTIAPRDPRGRARAEEKRSPRRAQGVTTSGEPDALGQRAQLPDVPRPRRAAARTRHAARAQRRGAEAASSLERCADRARCARRHAVRTRALARAIAAERSVDPRRRRWLASQRLPGSTCSRPPCCCSTTSAYRVRQPRGREPVRAVAPQQLRGRSRRALFAEPARSTAAIGRGARAPARATPSRTCVLGIAGHEPCCTCTCTVTPIDDARRARCCSSSGRSTSSCGSTARSGCSTSAGQPRADPQPRARDQESAGRHPRRGATARARAATPAARASTRRSSSTRPTACRRWSIACSRRTGCRTSARRQHPRGLRARAQLVLAEFPARPRIERDYDASLPPNSRPTASS